MKKLYVFAENVEPRLRLVAILVVGQYFNVLREYLKVNYEEIKVAPGEWSGRTDEIGVAAEYVGPSKEVFYSIVDEMDEGLRNERFVGKLGNDLKENMVGIRELIDSGNLDIYGIKKIGNDEFLEMLTEKNIKLVLNALVVNIVKDND